MPRPLSPSGREVHASLRAELLDAWPFVPQAWADQHAHDWLRCGFAAHEAATLTAVGCTPTLADTLTAGGLDPWDLRIDQEAHAAAQAWEASHGHVLRQVVGQHLAWVAMLPGRDLHASSPDLADITDTIEQHVDTSTCGLPTLVDVTLRVLSTVTPGAPFRLIATNNAMLLRAERGNAIDAIWAAQGVGGYAAASAWARAGFGPAEAGRWVRAGVSDPTDAAARRCAGLTPGATMMGVDASTTTQGLP